MLNKLNSVTMQASFYEMRDKFSNFYDHVKAGHEAHKDTNRGHDLSHDVTVAQIALEIAPDPLYGEMAWCAALLHSMDYWKRRDHEAFEQFVAEAMYYLIGRFTED